MKAAAVAPLWAAETVLLEVAEETPLEVTPLEATPLEVTLLQAMPLEAAQATPRDRSSAELQLQATASVDAPYPEPRLPPDALRHKCMGLRRLEPADCPADTLDKPHAGSSCRLEVALQKVAWK